jgi:hypothetical protein
VKNDFKHDRGPVGPEDIARAADELQETLRRSLDALAFFAEYPIRREDRSASKQPCKGDLSLKPGNGDWRSLYPFIVPMTCPRCEKEEAYFIGAWDRKKNRARLKSFEKGHTINETGASNSLAEWSSTD